MSTICKNCNQEFRGNFCSHCGQSAQTHAINLHFLWHDIQHGLFHFDKGIFYTLKQLFTRPGYAVQDFLRGKRVRHFKPFSLLVVLATIFGFLSHFSHINIAQVPTSKLDAFNLKIIHLLLKAKDWLIDHYALVSVFIYLPISTIATYWAFGKKQFNFAEQLILQAFVASQGLALRMIPLVLSIFVHQVKSFAFISTIFMFISAGFGFWTYFQFFNETAESKRVFKIFLSFFFQLLIIFVLLVISAIVITFSMLNN